MDTKSAQRNISSYIIQSQEDEIKRIAIELHEGVGQTLYSLYTGMQFIESSVEGDTMKGYVGGMAEILERTIQEIRLLSVELHPPTLTTLGLLPAMKSYIKLYTSTYGIEVHLMSIGEEVSLKEKERITLFRVCQEALANIARYADTVTAEVTFIWEQSHLRILIKDAGKGFDMEKGMNQSTGLAAMQERMLLIGGQWFLSSKIGAGTQIELHLPLL
ncbi:histidine kinase [Bacillus sp. DTU_2020_1000418_1_SI_GHA_SEK_038]|uniref:sensor histidine kinase n=1 Tax=Bacillus sp. DTU_2020_1000418_1_SI_GHA_SEK_038 TaxID=3077585 RepID=UPI0028E4B79A|nr:ATP-binding protein [Bacillus sp. DTU_2020_1000418_1_SI_GHA_SEK_038]WNS73787.1 histidine kinase [Bacillus sp. DTU_2020_1000418_1_SI_GHA_SEK_038]